LYPAFKVCFEKVELARNLWQKFGTEVARSGLRQQKLQSITVRTDQRRLVRQWRGIEKNRGSHRQPVRVEVLTGILHREMTEIAGDELHTLADVSKRRHSWRE
jgi:hypothetical protein